MESLNKKWRVFGLWCCWLFVICCAEVCSSANCDNMLKATTAEVNYGSLAEEPDKNSFNSTLADKQDNVFVMSNKIPVFQVERKQTSNTLWTNILYASIVGFTLSCLGKKGIQLPAQIVVFSLLINSGVATHVFDADSLYSHMRDYTLLGDATIDGSEIRLSGENPMHPKHCLSSGAVFYNTPIRFFDFDLNRSLSFNTSFGFYISIPPTPTRFGDGLSLIISPTPSPPTAAPFGYPSDKFFGIAIDSRLGPSNSPSETYIRVYRNTLFHLAASEIQQEIRSGDDFTLWADFDGLSDMLKIYLGLGMTKPLQPNLNISKVDLKKYLNLNDGIFYMGITSSSQGCSETYHVHSWEFDQEKENKIIPHKEHVGEHGDSLSLTISLILIGVVALTGVLFGCQEHDKMNKS